MNGGDCVPRKHDLQKQAVDQIWPTDHSLSPRKRRLSLLMMTGKNNIFIYTFNTGEKLASTLGLELFFFTCKKIYTIFPLLSSTMMRTFRSL